MLIYSGMMLCYYTYTPTLCGRIILYQNSRQNDYHINYYYYTAMPQYRGLSPKNKCIWRAHHSPAIVQLNFCSRRKNISRPHTRQCDRRKRQITNFTRAYSIARSALSINFQRLSAAANQMHATQQARRQYYCILYYIMHPCTG